MSALCTVPTTVNAAGDGLGAGVAVVDCVVTLLESFCSVDGRTLPAFWPPEHAASCAAITAIAANRKMVGIIRRQHRLSERRSEHSVPFFYVMFLANRTRAQN